MGMRACAPGCLLVQTDLSSPSPRGFVWGYLGKISPSPSLKSAALFLVGQRSGGRDICLLRRWRQHPPGEQKQRPGSFAKTTTALANVGMHGVTGMLQEELLFLPGKGGPWAKGLWTGRSLSLCSSGCASPSAGARLTRAHPPPKVAQNIQGGEGGQGERLGVPTSLTDAKPTAPLSIMSFLVAIQTPPPPNVFSFLQEMGEAVAP